MSLLGVMKLLPNAIVFSPRCLALNRNVFRKRTQGPKIKPLTGNAFFCDVSQVPKTLNSTKDIDKLVAPRTIFTLHRQHLLNSPKFAPSVFREEQLLCARETSSQALRMLRELATTEENLHNVWDIQICLTEELSALNYDDLVEVLGLALCCSKMHDPKNLFDGIISDLSKCLEAKRPSLSIDELLRIFDILSLLDGDRKCHFQKQIGRLCKGCDKLSPWQTVHLFYCLQNCVYSHKKLAQFKLQEHVKHIISEISTTDLAIIAKGFSKNNLSINFPGLFQNMATKVLEEIETIEDVNLHLVLRCLIRNDRCTNREPLQKLLQGIMPHISKFSVRLIKYILAFNLQSPSLDCKSFEILFAQVKKNIKECSLIDIARVIEHTALFNVCDEELLNLAIAEMETNKSSPSFPFAAPYFLVHLVHHQIYPKQLLECVLNHDFVQLVNKKHQYKNWWFLNCSMEIEKPEFHVKLTEKDMKKFMGYSFMIEQLSAFTIRQSYQLEAAINHVYGKDKTYFAKVLPHYMGITVMVFDKDLKALEIPEEYKNMKKWIVKRPLDDNIWLSIFILPGSYEKKFAGSDLRVRTKIRQLVALGYVPVTFNESDCVKGDAENDHSYIEKSINAALQYEQQRRLVR